MSNRRQLEEAATGAQSALAAQRSIGNEEPPIGAHLVTPRLGYTHHGVYVGEDRVVHYSGWSQALLRGPVQEVSLADFAAGRDVSIRFGRHTRFSPEEIVTRARSRLGENQYRLITNNCEHFCEWCLSGESRSEQIEQFLAWVRVPALAAARVLEETVGAPWLSAASRLLRNVAADARA